jgi:DNA repair and recombination protein RAD52
MFTEQQLKALEAPLARERVKQRQGAGRQQLSYIEAWDAIATANEVFGHGCWSRETVLLEPLHDPKLVVDDEDATKTKVVACFVAKARLTIVSADGQRSIVREGFGAARGFGRTVGDAAENALKAAESDALKRALATFGNQFGLPLYDREQRGVAALGASAGREQAIDAGFDAPKLTTSERAAPTRRPNGRKADVGDLPV